MAIEKKPAAPRLHHWVLDPDGSTRCQNCNHRSGLGPAYCEVLTDPEREAHAEIERLKIENEKLRRDLAKADDMLRARLLDAEVPPLHKRGK